LTGIDFEALVFCGSVLAGLLGALTGLGGGVVIVPMLTILFGIDFRHAIGASIVSVIATSSAAASAYVREGYTNMRLGMFLEIATTIGAVVGAMLTAIIPASALGVVFGLVLLFSAVQSFQQRPQDSGQVIPVSDTIARKLHLYGRFPADTGESVPYGVRNVPLGFGLMALAGAVSGLLGIGSGAFKVLAMDRAMRIPFKVSTTTSNFMIGVTASASAVVYFSRGYIHPLIAGPVMLGVLVGALLGTKCLVRWKTKTLRIIFAFVLLALGLDMLWTSHTAIH
jgi:hypothetical protein